MQVYLKFNSSKIYKKAASVLTDDIVNKDDAEKSIIIDVCDYWSAGQIINALSLSLTKYCIIPNNESNMVIV